MRDPENLNPPKRAARLIADALPIYRVYKAYKVAEMLRTDMRDPSRRTWQFAGRVALYAVTDMADGKLARWAGPTRRGGFIDQLGDKLSFLIIAWRLARNGEIAWRDFIVPAIRDTVITVSRFIIYQHGVETDADEFGKEKAVMQAKAATVACSPLAVVPGLVPKLFHEATELSAGSGVTMLQKHLEGVRSARLTDDSAAEIPAPVINLLTDRVEPAA